MKYKTSVQSKSGVTMFEVMIVLATLTIVGVLLHPMWTRSRIKGHPMSCVNNMKQIGLSFRIFANDHGDRYPQEVPASEGGARESVARNEIYRMFQVMGDELSVPRVVVCPADDSPVATDWVRLKNHNISYFVGLEASDIRPHMILAGDRNLVIGNRLLSGRKSLQPADPIQWSATMHGHAGHITLADGSAQFVDTKQLEKMLKNSGDAENLVLFPQ